MNETAISVEGLAKRFGEVVALDGVDFDVAGGSVFGLLGPNGAGKTTAVRVLSTILRPDGGTAEVLGFDVVRQAEQVRHVIGLAGQNAAVDPNLTGRENLRLIGRLTQLPRRQIESPTRPIPTPTTLTAGPIALSWPPPWPQPPGGNRAATSGRSAAAASYTAART